MNRKKVMIKKHFFYHALDTFRTYYGRGTFVPCLIKIEDFIEKIHENEKNRNNFFIQYFKIFSIIRVNFS